MKKTLKLIPAFAMLLVAAILVSTSTYAWFSMNRQVTATGMQVKAVVSDSLLIAASSAGTTKANEDAFIKGIDQPLITATLQPSSTVDAADATYYYTYDAKADGSKATVTTTEPYLAVTNNTITVGSNTYNAYLDYVLELKAINSNSSPQDLIMTELNLLYKGETTANHAYRVALFVQEYSGSAYPARSTAASKIFAVSGFDYFGTDDDAEAVTSTTAKGAVTPDVNASGWRVSVPAQETKYYKLTFRLWLEGEDTDCFTEKFVTLTEDWRLDLAFELVATSSGTAVQAIGSAARATATGGTATLTLPSGWADSAVTYAWKNANGTEATGTNNAASYTASSTGDFYCLITTNRNTVYRTNTVHLTTP